MKKTFLFRHIPLHGVKVSHAMAVGLPSLTGVTGLAGAFAAELARAAGLPATALTNAGVLLAFDSYHLHEGYKKITDKAGAGTANRALASAFASFNAHLILEVEGTTPAADEALANLDLVDVARDVLRTLRLCGASLMSASRPVRIDAQKAQDLGGERYAALALIPSKSRVLVSASSVVVAMREQGLPLMEGLIAASLYPSRRPERFKAFFEQLRIDTEAEFEHTYGVVHDGYLTVGEVPDRKAARLTFTGERLPVTVASPTLGLVRLQTAASLRMPGDYENGRPADFAFWRVLPVENGFLCSP